MDPVITHEKQMSLSELLIKIKQTFSFLKSKWLTILLVGVIGLVIGFVFAAIQKVKYNASTTFVLDEGTGNGGGGLAQYAGIASMVGVDIGGGGNGGLFKEDNLLELYKSRSVIEKALLGTYSEGKNQLLIDRYIQIYKLKKSWPTTSDFQNVDFYQYGDKKFSRLQDSIITSIVKDINNKCLFVSKPDKKLDIIQVKVISVDEKFSKCFDNKIVNIVNDFYIQTKTKKSAQNLAILQHQADSIRAALNGALTNVASSIDANPNANPSRQILRVPSQKKQVDAEANKAILTELVKNLEISKVALRKETPLIVVLDEPIYPLNKEKLSKVIAGGVGAILGVFIAVISLLFNKLLKESI
jgi:hypothetical protein